MTVVLAVTVSHTLLPGVLLIEPQVYGDERGFFMETWSRRRYAELGITEPFVQDNLSFSRYGVLRGLHFQHPNDQGKLVYVLRGEVFDVAVDVRRGSPTFGRWTGITLSWGNKKQLYIPPGFAHGFCVTSDTALFAYKCTEFHHPPTEGSVAWDDPDIGIHWPISDPRLSPKDQQGINLKEMSPECLPVFGGRERDDAGAGQ